MILWLQYFFLQTDYTNALNYTFRRMQNLYHDKHDPVATIFFFQAHFTKALNQTLRRMQNLYQDKHDPLGPERGPAEEEGGYDHNWKSKSFQFKREARKKPFWKRRFFKNENSVNYLFLYYMAKTTSIN